jgi:hypothetical protein
VITSSHQIPSGDNETTTINGHKLSSATLLSP